ncbi:MAG: ATP-binding protein [Polyangiaceae bacterium]
MFSSPAQGALDHPVRPKRRDASNASASTSGPSETFVGLAWLLRLRWGAVVGQLIALFAARFLLSADLPWLALGALVGLTALSNVALSTVYVRASAGTPIIPLVLVGDALVLTAMLFASGGPANPFSVFFLVHVALASLLLPPRAAWGLVGLTVLAFGSLFLRPAHNHLAHVHGSLGTMHLFGMWVSYALTASFVTYFIGKVSLALRDRDRDLAAVEHLALQNERLATLSSFSANAAHELATPLATIGLAAKELASGIGRGRPAALLQSDADLICQEVARCRTILAEISNRAGESVGEMPTRTTPAEVVGGVDRALTRERSAAWGVTFAGSEVATAPIVVPKETLVQMLVNLIKNGLEANEARAAPEPVELRVRAGRHLSFHVLDRGTGLSASVERRLGEPFITTKAHLGGMGLGVYLARSFADRLGGHLRFAARQGGGLEAELALPLDVTRSGP